VEQADDRWSFKYSPEFKRQAADRMMAGESVSALAKHKDSRNNVTSIESIET
jgi:transposase-like protein